MKAGYLSEMLALIPSDTEVSYDAGSLGCLEIEQMSIKNGVLLLQKAAYGISKRDLEQQNILSVLMLQNKK